MKLPKAVFVFLIALPITVFLGVVGLMLYRAYVAEPFYIPSASMEPTVLAGDVVWGEKHFQKSDLQIGDVIVFHLDGEDALYIKRIVAKGGDTVRLDGHQLFVNSVLMAQTPYKIKKRDPKNPCEALFDGVAPDEVKQGALPAIPYFQGYRDLQYAVEDLAGKKHWVALSARANKIGPQDWTVPTDSFFVMGDNRDNSKDSRLDGAIKAENVVAKASRIWYSATTKSYACGPQSLAWAGKFFRGSRAGLSL